MINLHLSGGLVGLGIPLLHHGKVEVLVGEKGGTDDHGKADSKDGSHQAAVNDCVDTFSLATLHLLLSVLVFVLRLDYQSKVTKVSLSNICGKNNQSSSNDE